MTAKSLSLQNLQIQSRKQRNCRIEFSSNRVGTKKIAAFILLLSLSCLFLAFGGRTILANIESLSSSNSSDDLSGITNLMTAVSNRDIEAIKYYTKSITSEINKKNYGGATALHLACRNGDVEIARILLENGAEINVADNEGWTPLMRAALASNSEIVELLLNRGATTEDLNSYGETAVLHAVSSGCGDCVVSILRKMQISKVIESDVIRNQMAQAYEIANQSENLKAAKAIADFNNQILKFIPFVADTIQSADETSEDSMASKNEEETQIYELEKPIAKSHRSKKGSGLRNLAKSRTPKKYNISSETKISNAKTPSSKKSREKYLFSSGKEAYESINAGNIESLKTFIYLWGMTMSLFKAIWI